MGRQKPGIGFLESKPTGNWLTRVASRFHEHEIVYRRAMKAMRKEEELESQALAGDGKVSSDEVAQMIDAAQDATGSPRLMVKNQLRNFLANDAFVDDAARNQLKSYLEVEDRDLVDRSQEELKRDGALIGADGSCLSADTALADLPAVEPKQRTTDELFVFVNGINCPLEKHRENLQQIADATGARCVGVYNATDGMQRDLLQCASDKLYPVQNLAVTTLSKQIVRELLAGHGMHIVCHSQGGLVTRRALLDAFEQLYAHYQDSVPDAAERHAKVQGLLGRLDIETLGSAARTWPDGPRYVHYVNTRDAVPMAFGLSEEPSEKNSNVLHPGRDAKLHFFADSCLPDEEGEGLFGKLKHAVESNKHTASFATHAVPVYLQHRRPFEEARAT